MSMLTPLYAGNYALYASPATTSQRHSATYLSAGFSHHTGVPVPFLPPELAAAMPLHPMSGLAAYGSGQYHALIHQHHKTSVTTTTAAAAVRRHCPVSPPNTHSPSPSSASSSPSPSGGCINFSIDGILGKTCRKVTKNSARADQKQNNDNEQIAEGRRSTDAVIRRGHHDPTGGADGQAGSPPPERHDLSDDSCSASHVPSLSDVAKSVDGAEGDLIADADVYEDAETHARFSWLQCTRYKPPKLPRMKRKDGVKKRKLGRNPRVPFTQHQVSLLEQKFRRTHYLSSVDVAELSAALNLTETRVKIWFQNRRARERRDRENMQQGGVSSARMSTSLSPGGGAGGVGGLVWPGPVPPNPSAVAQFSQALQQGTSAFTPVSFHAGVY